MMDLKTSLNHGSLPMPSKVTDQLGRILRIERMGENLILLIFRLVYAARKAGTMTSAELFSTCPYFSGEYWVPAVVVLVRKPVLGK